MRARTAAIMAVAVMVVELKMLSCHSTCWSPKHVKHMEHTSKGGGGCFQLNLI